MNNAKYRLVVLISLWALLQGCAGGTHMHEDYGKSVSHNTMQQTVNLEASDEVHPDIKMDGEKAHQVVENYRQERPEADTEDLTK